MRLEDVGYTGDEFTSPGHRGGFVAVVVDDTDAAEGFRALGQDSDREVGLLQAACSCGWRSSRMTAPPGTRWDRAAVAVSINPAYLTQAHKILDRLWHWHLTQPFLNDDN